MFSFRTSFQLLASSCWLENSFVQILVLAPQRSLATGHPPGGHIRLEAES